MRGHEKHNSILCLKEKKSMNMNTATLKKWTIASGKRAVVILPALLVMLMLTVAPTLAADSLQQGTVINMTPIRNMGATLLLLSLGIVAFIQIGTPIWPDWANKNKQALGQVLMGAILMSVVTALGTAMAQYVLSGS